MLISIQNDREFERLCHGVLDRPGLEKDPDYATNKARNARRDDTNAIVPEEFWRAELRRSRRPARRRADRLGARELGRRSLDPSAAPAHRLRLDQRRRLDPGARRLLDWRARAAGRRADGGPAHGTGAARVRAPDEARSGRAGFRLSGYGARLLLRRRRLHELLAGVAARPRHHRRRDRHAVHEPPARERGCRRSRIGWLAHRRRRLRGVILALAVRRHRADDRLPVLLHLPRHPAGQPGVGRRVGADHGALRRRAGERDQGARLQLRQPARLELGGLHPGHA